MRRLYFIILSFGLALLLGSSCSEKEGGNCSISCGGAGTGQPFVQTNNAFVTEEDCKQMGIAKGKGCKTSFVHLQVIPMIAFRYTLSWLHFIK